MTQEEAVAVVGVLQNIDWTAVTEAVVSGFSDTTADSAAMNSIENAIAPELSKIILAAAGAELASFVPFIGPFLLPALGLAVANFKGGDPDPMHDAQLTQHRGGRNYGG